jgi:1-aminocyclopropane-1-carboxylate deaminase/D-cysteine desulfhydrase-like pyridoxal-dependent ACC family enzyme
MHKLTTQLRIHQNGDLHLQNITDADISIVALDTSISKQKLYQQHQEYLTNECNKNSLILGVIFAATIGLIVYSVQNLEMTNVRKNVTTILQFQNRIG